MQRFKTFQIINDERRHQVDKWGQKHDEQRSLEEWADLIERYLEIFRFSSRYFCLNSDTRNAMACMRKIAALAVACMEHNETPERKK